MIVLVAHTTLVGSDLMQDTALEGVVETRRTVEWIVTGVLAAVLLAGGFLLAIFHRDAASALGLARAGAPATVAPELFEQQPEPTTSAEPSGTGLVTAAQVPSGGTLPNRGRLEAKLNALDTAKLAGVNGAPSTWAYEVLDAETGEVIAARNATTPLIPASNTKTLTTLAVMHAFKGDETFATTVVQPAPGAIVLVGGGDPLLLSVPAKEGTYPQPPTTQKLAADTAKALLDAGQSTVTLGFDAGYFAEPGWNATWPSNYRDQVTQLSALWVDEGRLTAGGRSRTPALDAAKIFAAQLAANGVTVTGTPTQQPASGAELARVESLPVHVLVETAMNRSNNSFTEVLGLQLAKLRGKPTTFAGSVESIQAELTALGVWDKGTVLHDASGLSRDNRITSNMLAKAVRLLDTEAQLSVILDGLPTAGVTGTLADRFTDDISRPARGVARAKTGTLSLVSTLAGTTITEQGRVVTFAFMVNGPPDGWAAKVWADQATGVVASCGC